MYDDMYDDELCPICDFFIHFVTQISQKKTKSC